jgi:hypothetical protein
MADTHDDIQEALEDARRAREDAERLRKEAKQEADRLKDEARRARDEARRLRDEARNQARRERGHGPRNFGPPPGPNPPGYAPRDPDEDRAGVRSEQSFSTEGVRTIQIDQTAGKLTVRTCKEGETPGIVSTGNRAVPEIGIQRDGDRLQVEIKLSKGWLFRRRQGATTLIRLGPEHLDQLRIDNGYGETEIQAVQADDLRVNVSAGSLQCILTRGNIDANVGAGKLSILSHSGLAKADSGTGDVLLDVAELAEGDYKVDVGLGRAEVRLPAGGQVNIKASSGIGKSRIEYPSAPDGAPTRVRVNSGIGECVVKQRDAGAGQPAAEPVRPAGQPRPQRSARMAGAASRRREAEEMRVLQMLEQGKISPQDAADLISALQGAPAAMPEDEETFEV